MRIMVTGGAGFIGSHVVDELVRLKHNVSVIDNLSSGRKQNLNPAAKFYLADLCYNRVIEILEQEQPEIIMHLAAQTSVSASIANPSQDAQVNILGTLNLLNAAIKTPVKKIIYSSSAAVYGFPEYLPLDEQHPRMPLSPYGLSKYIPERHLQIYDSLYGLDYTILRYANVYGERQDAVGEGGVVAIFFNKALKSEVPIIYGDGEQTRDFIYVHDVVKANIAAIYGGSRQVFNIGTGVQTSINNLWKILQSLTGQYYPCEYAEARKGDIRDSALDGSWARFQLGYRHKYSLQDGLQNMYRQVIPQKKVNI